MTDILTAFTVTYSPAYAVVDEGVKKDVETYTRVLEKYESVRDGLTGMQRGIKRRTANQDVLMESVLEDYQRKYFPHPDPSHVYDIKKIVVVRPDLWTLPVGSDLMSVGVVMRYGSDVEIVLRELEGPWVIDHCWNRHWPAHSVPKREFEDQLEKLLVWRKLSDEAKKLALEPFETVLKIEDAYRAATDEYPTYTTNQKLSEEENDKRRKEWKSRPSTIEKADAVMKKLEWCRNVTVCKIGPGFYHWCHDDRNCDAQQDVQYLQFLDSRAEDLPMEYVEIDNCGHRVSDYQLEYHRRGESE